MALKLDGMDFNNETLYSIEGTITGIRVARSSVNLLRELETQIKDKSMAAALVASLSEMHGVLANSLMLSLYEGEDTFNFAGLINGEIVFGVFSQANRIKDGDSVKLVVSRRGEILFVHSLLRKQDDLLMLPVMVYAGDRAFFKSCMRTALWLTVIAWVVFSICAYFFSQDTPFKDDALIIVFCIILIPPPILFFLFELRTYNIAKFYGLYASAIFKVFKFPDPDYLDVRDGMIQYKDGRDEYPGINWRIAVDKHKKQRENLGAR